MTGEDLLNKGQRTRFHRTLLKGITDALRKIFFENEHAGIAVANILKSDPKWGSRDRSFVAESIFDSIRWWRLHWFLLDESPNPEPASLFRLVAVNEILKANPLPDWEELKGIDHELIITRLKSAENLPAIRYSIPEWLDTLGQEELKEKWVPELKAMNLQAPVILRVNTLKTSRGELVQKLKADGFDAKIFPVSDQSIEVNRKGNLAGSPLFREGAFEFQDAGSQAISEFLHPLPGETVIDACAGAGGKTLHLAALMNNSGKIVAMDTEENRLTELKKRSARAGAKIIESVRIKDDKSIETFIETADKLLLDAPCSGTGTIRRDPDIKWKLRPEFLVSIRETQKHILSRYSKMLKHGGEMVYATCSILPSENQEQVRAFLQSHPEFILVEEKTLLPSESNTDGFFMARIRRA